MADEQAIDPTDQGKTGELSDSPNSAGSTADVQPEAEKERTDWKGLALTYKGKAERVNELERELQETRARLASPPTQTAPDPMLEIQQTIAELQLIRDRDPAARFALQQAQYQYQQMQEMRAEMELGRLSESERDGVRSLLQTGEFKTIKAARMAYLGSQSEAKEKEREAQAVRERERQAAAKARENAPDTATRSVPAAGGASMKYEAWAAAVQSEYANARKTGNFDKLNALRAMEKDVSP